MSKANMLAKSAKGSQGYTFKRPGFYRQLTTLLWRDSVVAVRDPTLYYLQVCPFLKSKSCSDVRLRIEKRHDISVDI